MKCPSFHYAGPSRTLSHAAVATLGVHSFSPLLSVLFFPFWSAGGKFKKKKENKKKEEEKEEEEEKEKK